MVIQKSFQKRVPPKTQTKLYFQAGRLLETGLACAFSTTKTTVRTTAAATTATIAETAARAHVLFEVAVWFGV